MFAECLHPLRAHLGNFIVPICITMLSSQRTDRQCLNVSFLRFVGDEAPGMCGVWMGVEMVPARIWVDIRDTTCSDPSVARTCGTFEGIESVSTAALIPRLNHGGNAMTFKTLDSGPFACGIDASSI